MIEWIVILGGLAATFAVFYFLAPKLVSRIGDPVDPARGEPISADRRLYTGQMVLISRGSKWFQGKIVEIHDDGRLRVNYDGKHSRHDEDVGRERLRAL